MTLSGGPLGTSVRLAARHIGELDGAATLRLQDLLDQDGGFDTGWWMTRDNRAAACCQRIDGDLLVRVRLTPLKEEITLGTAYAGVEKLLPDDQRRRIQMSRDRHGLMVALLPESRLVAASLRTHLYPNLDAALTQEVMMEAVSLRTQLYRNLDFAQTGSARLSPTFSAETILEFLTSLDHDLTRSRLEHQARLLGRLRVHLGIQATRKLT